MTNNLYYNKQLLSGICKVPRLTQSEYDALTTKPEFWILKDSSGNYKRLNADEVLYDKEVNDNKVSKSGDTMTGNLNIKPSNALGVISLGKGNNSSEYGVVQMYDDASHWLNIMPSSLTDNRAVYFPDKTGTVALTSDLKEIQSGITPQGSGAGEMGLRTVTFAKPFSSVPNVVVVPYHATSPHLYARTCTVQSVSTTGFTFVETAVAHDMSFYTGSMTTDPCYWIATVN